MIGQQEVWPFISAVDLAFQAILHYLDSVQFKIAENGHISTLYKDLGKLRNLNYEAFEVFARKHHLDLLEAKRHSRGTGRWILDQRGVLARKIERINRQARTIERRYMAQSTFPPGPF
jgi:hypothetical protein